MNIGVHFFDLLIWLFGKPGESRVHYSDARRMAGFLELERAQVKWFLSVDAADLPFRLQAGQRSSYRSITLDGQEIEFSDGFANLHTELYREVLAGRGFSIDDARPSVELVHRIRTAEPVRTDNQAHPFLKIR